MITATLSVMPVIAQLAAWSMLGWLAVRRQYLGERGILRLAGMQINLFVPLTIFVSTLRGFDPADPASLWLIPKWGLWTALFLVLGMAGTLLALRIAHEPWRRHQVLFAITLISNAVFIPTPIIMAVLPEELVAIGLFHMSVYLIYLQTMNWTLGVVWVGGKIEGWRPLMRRLINPPIISLVLGFACALLGPLREAFHPSHPFWNVPALAKYLVGPVGMILLGCLMAQVPPQLAGHRLDIACACALRGFVVPAVTLLVLLWLGPEPVMALVVMIQASTPPATNLSVIAAYYKGPVGRITSTFMPSYLLSCLTLPLWVGAALYLFGPF